MPKNNLDLQSFTGKWTILREIRDERENSKGRMEGFAKFSAHPEEPNALIMEETGILQMVGAPALTANRKYIWRDAEGGPVIDVRFEDGRPFHKIDLNKTMPFDTHICSPDLYEVSYDFRRWPSWIAQWRVTGPRKNYRLWSRFRYTGEVLDNSTTCENLPSEAETSTPNNVHERGEAWQSTTQTGS